MTAKIIAIEGADRTGKATQAKMLRDYLLEQGHKVAHFEVPYDDGVTHKAIYAMLKNGMAKKHPKLFQTVQYLNKRVFQETHLRHLRETMDYIILDRWSLSGLVYGEAEGVPRWYSDALFNNLVKPDCTIVLANAPHVREGRDVYEKDTALQAKVRMLYQGMFEFDSHLHNTGRISVVRSAGTPEQVAEKVRYYALGEYYG